MCIYTYKYTYIYIYICDVITRPTSVAWSPVVALIVSTPRPTEGAFKRPNPKKRLLVLLVVLQLTQKGLNSLFEWLAKGLSQSSPPWAPYVGVVGDEEMVLEVGRSRVHGPFPQEYATKQTSEMGIHILHTVCCAICYVRSEVKKKTICGSQR